jgi:predicted acetyltransferase
MMKVELNNPSKSDRNAIKNLFVYYRYDLMPYIDTGQGSLPNASGVIGNPRSRTHEDSLRWLDVWWKRPGILYPMLLRVDDTPAGFVMVARAPHAHPGADFEIVEFFVLNKFRGSGVGSEAVRLVLERFQGTGALRYLPKNAPAAKFWQRSLEKLAKDVQPISEGNPGFTFRTRGS